MTHLGASLLETLLAADPGHRGPRIDCGQGHEATFVAYRTKTVDTVLGPIEISRAYYHCPRCHRGLSPKDDELGIACTSITSGLRPMLDRTAAAVPFARATDLLADLAGITLSTKRVGRADEADGRALHEKITTHADAVADGSLTPLPPGVAPKRLYVAVDGTGIPATTAETTGRAGKHPDGKARTREVKLGVIFTQTKTDEKGRPVRDPGSSSYVATLDPAAAFGRLVHAEARRRGSAQTGQVIVLGDGARPGSGTSQASTSPQPPRSSICSTPASTSTTSPPSPRPPWARPTPTGSPRAWPNSTPATSTPSTQPERRRSSL
ncbi:MAG: hypothetical protein L0H79_20105 [Intrasporangium sp.]|uniref:hypothetical protein n=1 Tax=Intrasporangium sp. TaxID=1925024 RepID=UPI0026491718|nr:hypothetical protein [Intrasporangium sp.]MDN5798029.1 hypothetical protein [Intrasporangium sp.]